MSGLNHVFLTLYLLLKANQPCVFYDLCLVERFYALSNNKRSAIHIDRRFGLMQKTFLHMAASFGFAEMTELLVNKLSADIKVVDKYGRTPEKCAALSGHLNISKYLRKLRLQDYRAC